MAVLAIAILASTSTLPATQGKAPQGTQGVKWWQSIFKEGSDSRPNRRRMEEIFQKALPTLKVQKTALDEAEAKFERLVERGDDNQVMEQVNLVEAACRLNKAR